jgi:hypothetical protein
MMNDRENAIEDAIRRAVQDGQFSNLPGAGKPLNMDDPAYEDPEWWLAHHLLKENDFTLPWIAERQEIEALLEQARLRLRRTWLWYQNLPDRADEWTRARGIFEDSVAELNRRIRDYNLTVPSPRFQRLFVRVDREIQRIQRLDLDSHEKTGGR